MEEYKRAVIQQAVIRGLDPDVPLKPSGVEWLGDIPEHWEVLPPKRVLQPVSPSMAPIKNTASPEPIDGYVAAFSASGQDIWLPEAMFHGSALVLSAVGARCGKTFKADGDWAVAANTHILFTKENSYRDYWWYVTNNEDWWERAGAAQPFVQVSRSLSRLWVVPPFEEQISISMCLDQITSDIDAAIAHTRREIELLEEYRTRLIADVVTGKLDVREAAASLPDGDLDDLQSLAEGGEADD